MEENGTISSVYRGATTNECDYFCHVCSANHRDLEPVDVHSSRDMIEKFIEEQEQQLCTAAGVVNPTNTSSYLSGELKRQSPNSSISFVAIHQQETMKRSLDQVEHEGEPSAKKTALNPANSSTSATILFKWEEEKILVVFRSALLCLVSEYLYISVFLSFLLCSSFIHYIYIPIEKQFFNLQIEETADGSLVNSHHVRYSAWCLHQQFSNRSKVHSKRQTDEDRLSRLSLVMQEYTIEIHLDDIHWQVKKRYSEFAEFHEQLTKQISNIDVKSLPPKKLLNNSSADFLHRRRLALDNYLKYLFQFFTTHSSALPEIFVKFLDFHLYVNAWRISSVNRRRSFSLFTRKFTALFEL